MVAIKLLLLDALELFYDKICHFAEVFLSREVCLMNQQCDTFVCDHHTMGITKNSVSAHEGEVNLCKTSASSRTLVNFDLRI